jgi:hypothetical protein
MGSTWSTDHQADLSQERFGCREWTANWTVYDFSKIAYDILAAHLIRNDLLDRKTAAHQDLSSSELHFMAGSGLSPVQLGAATKNEQFK